ncbi:MAG: hypothetical protein ACHQQR_03770 [Gemmatimonadales bacterium]
MKRFLLTAGAGALVIAMGACASPGSSATGPKTANFQVSAVDSALIAVHASGDATVSDVNMLNGISGTMGWSVVQAPSGVSMSFDLSAPVSFTSGPGNGCTLNPADGRFDCPPQINANGVTVVRSLAFYDASGTQMNHFDSTTASMNVQSTENGVIAGAAGADTVNGSRNLTATGLLGHNTTRIWNGTGGGTHGAFWSDSAASRTADVSYNSTFSDVVVALPRSSNPYPVSGSISRVVTGSGVVTKGDSTKTVTISRTVGITFNGTEFVPMTVGSQMYTLDLATGRATKN